MIRKIEINEGQIIVEFETKTGEICDVYDWHGRDVSSHWQRCAEDAVLAVMEDNAVIARNYAINRAIKARKEAG